jgi:hypothetical protein
MGEWEVNRAALGTVGHPFVMMVGMETFDISIECGTCVATGTTACADCVVTHLLANDDGPIDLVTVAIASPRTATDRAIALFRRAGLLDDPVEFVDRVEFERGVAAPAGA